MMTFLEKKYDELNGITPLPEIYRKNKLAIILSKLKLLFKNQKSEIKERK